MRQHHGFGFFLGHQIGPVACRELADGFFALLDRFFDQRHYINVGEHDALIHFALLDRSEQHADGAQTHAVARFHGGFHVGGDAVFKTHSGAPVGALAIGGKRLANSKSGDENKNGSLRSRS